MRLTTRGRYAVTAMLDLALHHDQGPITLADVADRQRISLAYLEQLFTRLRRRGLVQSARGPRGGYRLGRDAADVSVAEVIAAVDESVDATRCGGKENCHDSHRCLTHDLWEGLSREIHSFLSRISLAELVAGRDAQQQMAKEGQSVSIPVWKLKRKGAHKDGRHPD